MPNLKLAQREFKLKEEELPFKVKRKTRPLIIKRRTVPKGQEGLEGTFFAGDSGVIELFPGFHDNVEIIEHETVHFQLRDRRQTETPSPEQDMAGEIQADLITFSRIGKPQNYDERFSNIAARALEQLEGWEVSKYTKGIRVSSALEFIVKNYWPWLPKQWKNDWGKFKKELEVAKQNALKNNKGLISLERKERINSPQGFLVPQLGIKKPIGLETTSPSKAEAVTPEVTKPKGRVAVISVKDTPTLTELRKVQAERSTPSQMIDNMQTHQITITADNPRTKSWLKDQGRMDIIGIDAPSRIKRPTIKTPKFKTPTVKRSSTTLKGKKMGKVIHTKMKGGTALSRRRLKGLKRG